MCTTITVSGRMIRVTVCCCISYRNDLRSAAMFAGGRGKFDLMDILIVAGIDLVSWMIMNYGPR